MRNALPLLRAARRHKRSGIRSWSVGLPHPVELIPRHSIFEAPALHYPALTKSGNWARNGICIPMHRQRAKQIARQFIAAHQPE